VRELERELKRERERESVCVCMCACVRERARGEQGDTWVSWITCALPGQLADARPLSTSGGISLLSSAAWRATSRAAREEVRTVMRRVAERWAVRCALFNSSGAQTRHSRLTTMWQALDQLWVRHSHVYF
jgi:hypothetical protein